MAELPGFVWISVGIIVGVFSLFLGYLRPVENSIFFKFMMFVGFGMALFGFIKIKLRGKTKESLIDKMQQRHMQQGGHNHSESEINMDDYKNNPYLRQKVLQGQGGHGHQAQQVRQPQQRATHQTAHHAQQIHPSQKQTARFCHQCGVPLMKSHKFCPMCGTSV